MIVCICNNVSDRDIAREAASGCPSFGQLQMRTGVAAGCGACHDCALQTFVEHRSACPGRSSAASHGNLPAMMQASAVA
jgi:bacterioferritin-associated ferredoxin